MVKGVAALHRRFDQVPDLIRAEVVAAIEAMADEIVNEMRSIAPKGETRKLVNSIGWTWGSVPKGALSVGSVRGREYGKLSVTIYAGGGEAFYARIQEFGSVKMAANPYFYPTYRANKTRAKLRISAAVRRAFKKSK